MAENQNEIVGNKESQPALSVGAILRAEREARGLSVEEIAERVKFSVRQVEALEHDDTEHLPEGTFLRGFVRSYARVLGMDESKLLEATHTQTEHHFDVTDVQAGGAPLPVTGVSNQRSRYLMLGALAVALLLAVFVWMNPEDILSPVSVKPAKVDMTAPASMVSAAPVSEAEAEKTDAVQVAEAPKGTEVKKVAPVQAPVVAKTSPTAKPAPVVKPAESAKAAEAVPAVVAPKTVVTNNKPAAATAVSESEAPVAPPKPQVPLAQLMKRPIHIVFLEEAWMEIIDVNGEILLSRVTQAGEEKWIGGGHRAPYSITIGKPAAVRMYYHGKEVDLSQYNPASVAKLVLE